MNPTVPRSLITLTLAITGAALPMAASDGPTDPREANAWFAAGRAAVARAQPMIATATPASTSCRAGASWDSRR